MAINRSQQGMITLTIVAVMAIVLGFWLFEKAENAQLTTGSVLPKPLALQPFSLPSTTGLPFTNQTLKKHWSLLFFGFTRCPMVCPTTLAKLNGAYEWLKRHTHNRSLQVVFVSLDPQRDSLPQIKHYLNQFNAEFIGAVGDNKQLKVLTAPMQQAYRRLQPKEPRQSFKHTGSIMVVNPRGKLVAILAAPMDATAIAHDLVRIEKLWR